MNKRWIALLLCMTMLFSFMTVVQAEGKVEVVFWNGYTGPDQPVLEQIVNDFNASQDQVEIKMEIMPWDTLYQKLMPAMIAGNAPDVVAISVTRYSEYAMAGKLEALDSYIEKSTVITQDNLVPGLFNAGKYNGTQYALPMACAAMVMYYNKDMFRDAGLDPENPPKTMDELTAAWAKLIKKDASGNVTQYAQAIGVKATVPMVPVFMWANGAEYIVEGKSALNTPEAVEAMTLLANAFAEGVSPVGLTGQEADNLFAAQKAAIEFNGQWAIPGFRGAGIDLGIAEVPSGKGGHKTWGGDTILCMSADSKVKDAAWSFIEYFNNTEAQTKWSLGVGFIPTRLDMAENQELLTGNPDISIFMKASTYADIFMADQPLSGRIDEEILVPLYESVTRGTATPADALKKASDQLDALLAE
ncbi:MAG: ABC transporter substrate-binding protein [Candidatus Limiplasma sp.]|nr:ABC transporter substrate-binding protein [Candidatus Limiplasma sp.]